MSDINICVDLTNLRDITGGDPELEAELFEEFIQSSNEQITLMEHNTENTSNHQEIWRQNAHALKGISLTLGAHNLSRHAKIAQEQKTLPSPDKIKLLSDIKNEHAKVMAFLNNIPK